MKVGLQLKIADICGQIRAVIRRKDLTRPIALYGAADPGKVEVDSQLWEIIPVRSELEFRSELAKPHRDSQRVFLVDYDDRLPLDIACRLAGQRLYTVDRRSRLANLFGARKLAPGFVDGPLVDILLEEMPEIPPIAGTLLQPDDAWRRYLHVRLSLPLDEKPNVESLLRTALSRPEDGRTFGARRNDSLWGRLLAESGAWFERNAGPAARVVWEIWTRGEPRDLVAWVLHIDAERRMAERSALPLLRPALRYARDADESWLTEPIAGPLCAALDAILGEMKSEALRPILHRASQVFADPEFAHARRKSPWLVEAFDALQDDLAAAFDASASDSGAVDRVLSLFGELSQHRLAWIDAGAKRQQKVREAGVRIANWLRWLERTPLPDEEGWAAMGALARWYDTEGGWVDWARDEIRTHSTGHERLDTALRSLLDRADALRGECDRRFASAILSWYAAGQPATDVLPIDRVIRDVVVRFLENPTRRLLIVLLDGMSVPVALKLVEARESWAEVSFTPGKHRQMPPAIAALPTITATSRAAFFAGRVETQVTPGETEGQDPERFARNKALADLAGSAAGPRLFLRGSMGTATALSEPLLRTLRDGTERVVAVVVNAVDDQLKGSDQVSIDYERPESIPLLSKLFQLAQETERAILLVSDHGHVPVQQMKGRAVPQGTAAHGQRWRTLAQGQAPQEGEVELPEGCWKPKGAKSIAVLCDERKCWGEARVSAHGGLTLAEAVIPLRLLAPNWLYSTIQPPDDGLRTRDQEQPRWWRLLAPPQPIARSAPPPTTPQISLFSSPQPQPPPQRPVAAPQVPDRHAKTLELEANERFRAQVRDQRQEEVERALSYIDVLLREGGQMHRDAFARAVGVKSHRLPGRIAQLGFLNADGYSLIEYDLRGDQVRLRRDHLKTQYGLTT